MTSKNPFASSSTSTKKNKYVNPEEGDGDDDDVEVAERVSLLTTTTTTTPSKTKANSVASATAKSKRLLQETINTGISVSAHLKSDGELIDKMIERGRYHNQEIETADALLRKMERRRNMYKGIVVGVIAMLILVFTWLFGRWWKGKLKIFGG